MTVKSLLKIRPVFTGLGVKLPTEIEALRMKIRANNLRDAETASKAKRVTLELRELVRTLNLNGDE